MPEYLAPAVYVEEVDTGSKPIEGVSTSTAGMVGVTERGPLNVPILVTSYGEYRRWFGDALNPALYGEHRFLPHAVEGFFINGGKRVYVTRVLPPAGPTLSQTRLFLQEDTAGAGTLLARAAVNATSVLFVHPTMGAGIAANEWVRIGSGSEAEYRQAAAVPAAAAALTRGDTGGRRALRGAAAGRRRHARTRGRPPRRRRIARHRGCRGCGARPADPDRQRGEHA
jgi:phage tail sheath protein FI